MSPFMTERRVRFAHCDPAGIAYYPRLFEMGDIVIEDWCEAILGVSRRALVEDHGSGLPTVTLAAEFTAPARLGERLDITLFVSAVGASSVDLRLDARCAGSERFKIQYRQVLIHTATGSSRKWPSDWRERLQAALAKDAACG
ncbi:thioesterase [Erythrobacter sp. KY5]|uniref:acyl-CoA thioesterase n=1 Tax=Erythrobacter sp. KY5 TaxID=2011159 RepID=UPI000DBF048B|nr:thioesterase family protein [Erythrobacter sp. KY5]AWW74405.1 thioesterase [Erythrobacter sp. KY5]